MCVALCCSNTSTKWVCVLLKHAVCNTQWPVTCFELVFHTVRNHTYLSTFELQTSESHCTTHICTGLYLSNSKYRFVVGRFVLFSFYFRCATETQTKNQPSVLAVWCITSHSVEREPLMWTVWGPLLHRATKPSTEKKREYSQVVNEFIWCNLHCIQQIKIKKKEK